MATTPFTASGLERLLAEEDRCERLRNPNYINLIVSIIIIVGLLISYLPQHYRIISRGTSEGISPYFVLLGVTSATSGFGNILTTEPSRQDIACCKEVETFECLGGLLGIVQLGVQWLCFAVILVLFLVFFRYDDATVPEEELVEIEQEEQPRWQTAVTVGASCLAHGVVVIIVTGIIFIGVPSQLNHWANFLGVMASALAAVQYIPQILTTYRLKHVGSLSIPMMCIQTPGGFLFAASLFVRLGPGGWSTWGIFILTAVMQGCLLIMAVYFQFNKVVDEEPPPEESPAHPRRPLGPNRTYSEGLEEGLPGPYTAHPERYAETPEEYDRLQAREDRAVERDNASTPLLKPGGRENGHKNYNTTQT